MRQECGCYIFYRNYTMNVLSPIATMPYNQEMRELTPYILHLPKVRPIPNLSHLEYTRVMAGPAMRMCHGIS